jgi:CHASE1-domain containing sensor protein/two-component sensor histidine kinase
LKKLFLIVGFVAVALISLIMAGVAYFATQDAARIKFESTADDAIFRIESRINLHLSLLRTTQALIDARNGEISRREFDAFFKAIDVDRNFAGLRGIGFLRLVKAGDEAAAEQEIFTNYGLNRLIFPTSKSEWHAPTVLFGPPDSDKMKALGYDMLTDPLRKPAIERAMLDNEPHATGRLTLGKAAGSSEPFTGFLTFLRIAPETTPGEDGVGSHVPSGVLYAAFRSAQLFQVALNKAPLLPVNVEIYDDTDAKDNLLFRSETPPSADLGEKLLVTRELTVADRRWKVLFRPTSTFSPPSSGAIPVMLGLLGLLLAGAIALVARFQQRAYEAASSLHETTEKSLLEKELMLQEMKHRIKNLIARVLAIARQTAAGSDGIGEFAASFSARLQAMAASQDMLTRSRWQKADLGDLLRIELGQVFGKDLPDSLLGGPQVLLDETTTQALGLTFHELATNALKYGDAGKLVDAIKIRWRLEGRSRSRKLVLDWQETGQKQLQAPVETGFGTKLIDINITRELGGSITRDFKQDGLKVAIAIPLPE